MLARRSRVPRRSRLEELWRRDLPLRRWPLWAMLALATIPFRFVLFLRAIFWRVFTRPADVMTIAVGNLTVGGNSKTPFSLFLARRLLEQGLDVAILTRGYRGTRRRLDGIALLKNLRPLDAIVLDDAFQHLRLKATVNLLLVGAARGFGNGWMLPAGPMREPLSAARRADAIVVVASGDGGGALSRRQRRKLARRKVLNAELRPRALVHAERGQWRESPPVLAGRRVLAVSGLADSAGFYAMLRELDADLVGVLEYPDHHPYSNGDWQNIAAAARDADLIVTTEKDLVKLERFPFARDSLYALRLEVSMGADEARLLELIGALSLPPRRAAGG